MWTFAPSSEGFKKENCSALQCEHENMKNVFFRVRASISGRLAGSGRGSISGARRRRSVIPVYPDGSDMCPLEAALDI